MDREGGEGRFSKATALIKILCIWSVWELEALDFLSRRSVSGGSARISIEKIRVCFELEDCANSDHLVSKSNKLEKKKNRCGGMKDQEGSSKMTTNGVII